jgi:hypothetical protein
MVTKSVTSEEPILFSRNSTYLPVSGVARGESFRAFCLFPSLATCCAILPGGVGISVLGGEFGGRWEPLGVTAGAQRESRVLVSDLGRHNAELRELAGRLATNGKATAASLRGSRRMRLVRSGC